MAGSFLPLEAVVYLDGRILSRCLLRRGKFIIGQERRNEIVVDDDSISGRHARLAVASEEHFYLMDLDSANGTFVDGRQIEAEVQISVENEVMIGQVHLRFERGGLPAAIFQHLPDHFLRNTRYALGPVIIEGRTSTIYEARDTVLQRKVALKVLNRPTMTSIPQVLAFIRENQIVAQLPHSSILPVYDFGLDDEIGLYSATRFIEGESLGGLLTGMASGSSDAPHASLHTLLTIFLKACEAVAFANASGVVHGCLHPEAIIFGRYGEVFVDHWGTAKIGPPRDPERPSLVAPQMSAPPPISRCISPEQAADLDELNPRTDVFALGAILFRILTLRHFNNGESDEEITAAALHPNTSPAQALAAAPAPPHMPGGVIPERLASLCAAALSFDREERFSTASDIKNEIAHWLEQASEGNGAAKGKKSTLFKRG